MSFGIFSAFFYGLEIYPLTDLAAITFCMIAVILINKIRDDGRIVNLLMYSFFLGIVLYLSYNIRTIYLFAGCYLAVLLCVYLHKSGKHLKDKILSVASTFAGVYLGGLPQGYMNYYQLGHFNIKVPTNNLMVKQIFWGILYQRYDTACVDMKQLGEHPSYAIYFEDMVGQALVKKSGIEGFSSWGEAMSFILKHPVEVAGIYVRHLVNVLLPCWPNQYVEDLDNNKLILAILSYSCFFLFGLTIWNKCLKDNKVCLNYFPLLIPSVFILPGAVEVRYFASLYLIVIGALCWNTDWHKLIKTIYSNKMKTIIAFLTIGMLLLAFWSNMLASESVYSTYIIGCV